MFRMNGHDFCSRQIISTSIHGGNVAVPWMARSDDVQILQLRHYFNNVVTSQADMSLSCSGNTLCGMR